MIYTVTINPSIDQHITIKELVKDDTLKAEKIHRDPGGKGINVSRVVKELGGKTKAFGFIGGCAGYMLRDLLDRDSIDYKFCEILGETRINFIMTDLSDNSQTRVSAPGPEINKQCITELIKMLEQVSPRPRFWVFGGSLPPGAPEDTYKILIQYFQNKGERCVLDTDGEALKLGLEANPFLIKPNEFELERLCGQKFESENEILLAGREICEKGVEIVAISLGSKGAIFVTKTKAFKLIRPNDIEVRSKVGAGDSLIGGLLVALERNDDLESVLRWAIAAGTAAVMTEGTQLCLRKDVEELFGEITVRSIEYDDCDVKDIVCGMTIDKSKASGESTFNKKKFYFCSMICKEKFDLEPKKFLDREVKYTS